MDNQNIAMERKSSDFWFACVDIAVIKDNSLSLQSRAIFAIICTYAGINNRSCWPSIETLAKDAGVSKATVHRALKELSARGIIQRSKRFEDRVQKSSKILVVGFHADCYNEAGGVSPMTPQCLTSERGGVSPMTHRTIPMNNIINTLTREADLPNSTECYNENTANIKENETFDNPKPEKNVIKAPESQETNPEFQCVPEDAPEIMQATARYLLQRTGREKLAWPEIGALRELAATQVPARVQKEIDRAYNRFVKSGRDLKTLRFEYIASSLQNQPTRGQKSNRTKNKSQLVVNPPEIQTCSDDETEAEMAKIEEMQRKLEERHKKS